MIILFLITKMGEMKTLLFRIPVIVTIALIIIIMTEILMFKVEMNIQYLSNHKVVMLRFKERK